jgi:recombinational DNA repair protein (RecF pathway)
MHPIYHTDALILGSHPRGEANRAYLLLTADMGVFYAIAQGVRLEKSKLRYTLQDFSYARVDLVRGKDVWRITSATPKETFQYIYTSERGMRFLTNVQKLMRRLIRGEVAHPDILKDMLVALRFLQETKEKDFYTPVELTVVLRILHDLGYVSQKEIYQSFLEGDFNPAILISDSFPKKEIIEEIQHALSESQL